MGTNQYRYDIIDFSVEKFIKKLAKKFPNIDSVHIFGSRGYQTNSKRSGIDLLITLSSDNPCIDKTALLTFQSGYPPIDLFIFRESSAQSIINNSEIILRSEYKSLFDQLEAKCLWRNNTFVKENKKYLKQPIIKNQVFRPSYIPTYDPFVNFKTIIDRNSHFSGEQKTYLHEAICCYINECYLAFLSMMGTYYEDLLISLCKKYENRVAIQHSSDLTSYHNNVINVRGAKRRLEEFVEFIKAHDLTYFKTHGIESMTELETIFDIIRRYRNDIDHPTAEIYGEEDCNTIIAIFNKYVINLYSVIASL